MLLTTVENHSLSNRQNSNKNNTPAMMLFNSASGNNQT